MKTFKEFLNEAYKLVRNQKTGVHKIMKNGKEIGDYSYDSDDDNFVGNIKGKKGQVVWDDQDEIIPWCEKNC